MNRRLCAVLLTALTFAFAGGPSSVRAQSPTPDKIRLSLSPANYAWLPIFLAVDRGYFTQQNLDVQITKYNGSATTQIPILAHGDLDITPVVLSPALFNQYQEGFNLTLISSVSQAHAGWEGATWLAVRQDLWDSGAIRKATDLKGKNADMAAVGTPGDFILREALRNAKVPFSDVNVSYKLRSPQDWFAAFRNKAIDVVTCVEPACTVMQDQGLSHKWITYNDALPWFQDAYFASSTTFLKTHPDVVRRFLVAFLKGAQDVDKSGGKWSQPLLDEVAKWSEQPMADVQKIPGPNYTGQLGAVNMDSINRIQDILIAAGAVKTRIPADKIVDTSALTAARRTLNIR
jgi:NitT/TauT family transport system substrate-binding protein